MTMWSFQENENRPLKTIDGRLTLGMVDWGLQSWFSHRNRGNTGKNNTNNLELWKLSKATEQAANCLLKKNYLPLIRHQDLWNFNSLCP